MVRPDELVSFFSTLAKLQMCGASPSNLEQFIPVTLRRACCRQVDVFWRIQPGFHNLLNPAGVTSKSFFPQEPDILLTSFIASLMIATALDISSYVMISGGAILNAPGL